MWKPRHLTTLWASTALYRDSFTFYHTLHVDVWGSGGIAPRSLDIGTRWRRMVRIILWPLYSSGKQPSLATGQKVVWVPGPVWTLWRRDESLAPDGNRIPVPRPSIAQPLLHPSVGQNTHAILIDLVKGDIQAQTTETNTLNVLGSTPQTADTEQWKHEHELHYHRAAK
jgi:hypothetical protein